jgi:hypothetical protein
VDLVDCLSLGTIFSQFDGLCRIEADGTCKPLRIGNHANRFESMNASSALDAYEARIAMAWTRYCQAFDDSTKLPEFQQIASETIAFTTLQSVQQAAMRDLVASEFAALLNLRARFVASVSNRDEGRAERPKRTEVV